MANLALSIDHLDTAEVLETAIGDIIAGIPAYLQTAPHESIVVLLQRGQFVEQAARFDLNPAEVDQAHALTASLPEPTGMRAFVLLVASARAAGHGLVLVDDIMRVLRQAGIAIRAAAHTYTLMRHGSWSSILNDQAVGTFPDPVSTAAALEAGHQVPDSRRQILARYTPAAAPVDTTQAREAALRPNFVRNTLRELAAVVRTNSAVSDDLAARAGVMLEASLDAQDAALVVGRKEPMIAARVFTEVAARLGGQQRLIAVSVSAAFAYAAWLVTQAHAAISVAQQLLDQDPSLTAPRILAAMEDAAYRQIHPDLVRTEIIRASASGDLFEY